MDTVSCPRCGTGFFDPAHLVDGDAVCTRCGHRAVATHLAEQLWLEQQDRQLHLRLDWVRTQVRGGAPATTAGTPLAAGLLGTPGTPGTPAAPVPTGVPRPTPGAGGVQGLLLGTGAVLLVAAAAVFVAVTWELLGPAGQLSALGVVVAALAAAAHLARVRFRGTAEALAAVAGCVATVALLGAPALGLVTGWWLDHAAGYAALAFTLVAALSIALVALSGLTAWRVAAVGALIAADACLMSALPSSPASQAAVCAASAAVAAALLRLSSGRPKPSTTGPGTTGRRALFLADAGWLGSGLGGLALLDGLTAYGDLDRAWPWSLAWAVVAAAGWVISRPPRATGPIAGPTAPAAPSATATPSVPAAPRTSLAPLPRLLPGAMPGLVTPTAVARAGLAGDLAATRVVARVVGGLVLGAGVAQALVLAVRAAAAQAPVAGLLLLGLLGAAMLAATLLRRLLLPAAIATAGLWLLAVPVMSSAAELSSHTLAAFFGIVAASCSAMVPVRGRETLLLPATGSTLIAAAALDLDPAVALPVLALVGAGLLAATLVPRLQLPAAIATTGLWLLAVPVSWPAGEHPLAAFFGIVALSCSAMALVRGRELLVLPAAGSALITVHELQLDPSVALPVLAVLGAGLLAATLAPRYVVAGLGGAGVIWVGALPAVIGPRLAESDVATFLALVSAAGFALALRPRRGPAAWPAAVCGTASAWLWLSLAGADVLELYTGSAAALLVVAGALQWRDARGLGSLTVGGPALAVAILPSAALALADAAIDRSGVLRAVLVILTGTVLAIAGAAVRMRAAFLVGLAAALVAGLGQLFALVELLPRWVTLATGGALLLATGFTTEAIRTAGRQVRLFTGRMR